MPRTVDHVARRREITEAVWRLVRREGIVGVSVRNVAAEAGTSAGALRHYFATQDELLAAALTSVVERATERVGDLDGLRGREGAARVLEQLLPLDDERRDEVAVYLAFLGRPLTDPGLVAVRDEMEALSREAVTVAVTLLDRDGLLGPGTTPEEAVALLYPLLDGLALHGVQWPARYPPRRLRAALDRFLDTLAGSRA